MVRKKQHATKLMTIQPMESPSRSGNSNQALKAYEVEISEEKKNRQKQDKKATRDKERQNSEREEPPLPPLPAESARRLAIILFFIKPSKKKGTKKDTKESGPMELKENEKVIDETSKHDVRKLPPRKSMSSTPSRSIPDTQKSEDQSEAPAQAKSALEKEK